MPQYACVNRVNADASPMDLGQDERRVNAAMNILPQYACVPCAPTVKQCLFRLLPDSVLHPVLGFRKLDLFCVLG
jgi:hypothetical protein